MRAVNRLSMRLLGNGSYFCVQSKVSSGSGLDDFLILGLCLMYHQGGLLRNSTGPCLSHVGHNPIIAH